MGVPARARRHDWGRRALKAAIDEACEAGEPLQFEVIASNTAAVALYKSRASCTRAPSSVSTSTPRLFAAKTYPWPPLESDTAAAVATRTSVMTVAAGAGAPLHPWHGLAGLAAQSQRGPRQARRRDADPQDAPWNQTLH